MIEIWKDILGYEGIYQISNYGRVRSCDRYICQNGRWGMYERFYPSKILTPTDNGNGYLIIGLKDTNHERKNYYIHRLVANHFIENLEASNLVVNHKDYNRKNNKVSNLEWITQAENIAYSICNMKKPRIVFKTSTGYKHITIRNGKYRLNIKGKIDRTFLNLEDALIKREVVLSG